MEMRGSQQLRAGRGWERERCGFNPPPQQLRERVGEEPDRKGDGKPMGGRRREGEKIKALGTKNSQHAAKSSNRKKNKNKNKVETTSYRVVTGMWVQSPSPPPPPPLSVHHSQDIQKLLILK